MQGGPEGWLHSAEADPVGQAVLTLLADFAYGSVLWRGQCSLTDLIRNGSARQVAGPSPHLAMLAWDLHHTVQRSRSTPPRRWTCRLAVETVCCIRVLYAASIAAVHRLITSRGTSQLGCWHQPAFLDEMETAVAEEAFRDAMEKAVTEITSSAGDPRRRLCAAAARRWWRQSSAGATRACTCCTWRRRTAGPGWRQRRGTPCAAASAPRCRAFKGCRRSCCCLCCRMTFLRSLLPLPRPCPRNPSCQICCPSPAQL